MERTLTINGQLDSLNEYTRACRRNRYAGAKMKADNEAIISLYIGMQMKNLHFPRQGDAELQMVRAKQAA